MSKLKTKVLPLILILPAFLIALVPYFQLQPELWMRASEPTISLSQLSSIKDGPYTGKNAGADVPRLENVEQFESLRSCATAEPTGIIKTGVYVLKNWEESDLSRRTSNRRKFNGEKPEATKSTIRAFDSYHEYYLIKLPDGSYIPALFDRSYADKLERGESVTLPIGERLTTVPQAVSLLKDTCARYHVSPKYTLYMFDDVWYQQYGFYAWLIRLALAVFVFFLISIPSVLLAEKYLHFKI